MSNEVLVAVEHRRGTITDGSLQAVTAAVELARSQDSRVVVVAIARNAEGLVPALSVAGVDEVVWTDVASSEFNADEVSLALRAIVEARQPLAVLAAYSANMSSVAPGVAALLGLGFASDVGAVSFEGGALVATRHYYGGKVEAELEFPAGAAIVLLRPTTWAPAEGSSEPAVTPFVTATTSSRIECVELVDPAGGDMDLSKAEVILAIGRGVGEKENIVRFEQLADRMGVAIASSRPLVDAGWMPKFRQVGQSGVSVKPKLYIALGISGAVQHVAGIKGSDTIVAVNLDPQAPIFEVANLGAVADIFDVADELEALL